MTNGSPAGAAHNARSTVSRREFIGGAVAAWLAARAGAIAGPFSRQPGEFPIPADKKLSPEWLASLTARGAPTTALLSRGELEYIGMPVGGIFAGMLYLGGDGRPWLWDIFNLPPPREWHDTAGPLHANPARPSHPLEQGFAFRLRSPAGNSERILDRRGGWPDIRFTGQYPIGSVEYLDPTLPASVRLEAFSPFIPLNIDDSSLPATFFEFTVTNTSTTPVEVELVGWLQNAVGIVSGRSGPGARVNLAGSDSGYALLSCRLEPPRPEDAPTPRRPDIEFEDFERDTYDTWTTTGTAFGGGPRRVTDLPEYMGEINGNGERVVNTHETRSGEDVVKADTHVGTLLSRPFPIDRDYINFRIGGGNHPARTCVNLLIDGAIARTMTGENSNRMRMRWWDVKDLAGRVAQIQVVDDVPGGWGQVGVDDIVFSDLPREEKPPLNEAPDFGTMALACLEPESRASAEVGPGQLPPEPLAEKFESRAPLDRPLVGAASTSKTILPGQSASFRFVLAWHFPKLWSEPLGFLPEARSLRRHYATRFEDAASVVAHAADRYGDLAEATRLWRQTWYDDATLPHWFLERSLWNISTLATSTCFRFDSGRFYGWEGTYCCAGTCQHVWQYAQAPARLFPEFERFLREEIDFGLAFHEDSGAIDYRAEAHRIVAHDGLAGTILRAYREHTMSPDDRFLRRRWERIKESMELLIREDANEDGVLEGAQYNTLDTAWHGPMAWISSLYVAALRASAAMAREMNDDAFARRCAAIADRGHDEITRRLFNGEYFIHRPDPAHPEANNTNDGCHIDQVMGQSMAWQLGLPRVLPRSETVSALRSLYKYSFTPDVGPYRKAMESVIQGGRWYAMPGEGGLLMCTFPKGGADRATGKGGDAWAAGYFNECMSGFEHQVASHMVAEGLVTEGLAVTRMIHDRHHPSKRNPYNEVECSNHYSRAMASYGSFITACGFEHHGPSGRFGIAPHLTTAPNGREFRAAYTSAESWGLVTHERVEGRIRVAIEPRYGRLRLRSIVLPDGAYGVAKVDMGRSAGPAIARDPNPAGAAFEIPIRREEGRSIVELPEDLAVASGRRVEILADYRQGVS